MNVADWRVFYPDEVYASTETEWHDLPDEGVQVIVLYYEERSTEDVRYRKLLDGDDFYYHVPATDSDVFGSTNDRDEIPDEARVKKGLELPDEDFQTIKARAVNSSAP